MCVCCPPPHPSFGFHMGVDGASRNMAWLAVVPSNRDPVQILQLYVGALKEHGDWVKLRIDPGSENTLVASVHERLRAADNGGKPSTIVGTSHQNTKCVRSIHTHSRVSTTHPLTVARHLATTHRHGTFTQSLTHSVRRSSCVTVIAPHTSGSKADGANLQIRWSSGTEIVFSRWKKCTS